MTVILCIFAFVIVLNYLFVDDTGEKRAKRVNVTIEMIGRVRGVAPELTVETIRGDLMRTGDVQVTVERYLSGALTNPEPEEMYKRTVHTPSMNGSDEVESESDEGGNLQGPFNGLTYEQARRQMIKQGRAHMEKRLEHDIQWIN